MKHAAFALLASLLFSQLAIGMADAAEPVETVTWYDVELIVFAQQSPRTNETWPTDLGTPDIANAIALFVANENQDAGVISSGLGDDATAIPPAAPVPYTPLPESDYKLQNIHDALKRSSRYQPLLHTSWSQPALEPAAAVPVRLTLPDALQAASEIETDDNTVAVYEQFPGSTTQATTETADNMIEDEPAADRYVRPLDGIVKVSVQTYLQLNIDLLYLPDDINPAILNGAQPATQEFTEAMRAEREARQRDILEALARGDITLEEAEILSLEPEKPVFEGFRMNSYRRMRSGEIHYLDHPAFGVIITITPRKIPVSMMSDTSANPAGG